MFTKTKLVIALAALGLGFATSSFARHGADDPKGDVKGEGAGHPLIQQEQTIARRGAGEPGDVRGEGAGHPVATDIEIIARRGRGADDKPGDDRGVHAPGHPLSQDVDVVARRGAGEPGDVRGEGAGHPVATDVEIVARRGRGKDDPVGHG